MSAPRVKGWSGWVYDDPIDEHVFIYETPCEYCGKLLDENGFCVGCD